ncbi:uncharacterized protein LOC135836746 [Planococcus citri]|uniref:uncharacterized protein LOC135836746 n=1 Tax=Planococcus citri TaxID=170843 RepID=UPI0031F943C1
MSLFENDENFDDILTKAKRIDKGILHLEKKLSNVKNLGVSFAPEETKITALNVLKEYDEEVSAMKENCEHCLEEEEKMLKESIEANEGIMNFITNMKNDLDKIEENMKSMGQYQPYVDESLEEKCPQHDSDSPIVRRVSHNRSDSVMEKSLDELETNNASPSLLMSANNSIIHVKEPYQKMTNGKSFDTGSLCSESNGGFNFNVSTSTSLSTPVGVTKNFSKYSEKSNDSLDACHTPLLRSTRKPISFIDDACRTPIDPGISLASMKLLGKSNIKTKVYKSGISVTNQKLE